MLRGERGKGGGYTHARTELKERRATDKINNESTRDINPLTLHLSRSSFEFSQLPRRAHMTKQLACARARARARSTATKRDEALLARARIRAPADAATAAVWRVYLL